MIDKTVLPLLKHTSPVFEFGDVIRIGGFGEATEIADPDRTVRHLLALLDGTRTPADLHRELAADHPDVSLQDIETVLAQFDDAGFLLDARQTPDGLLDDYDQNRWQRNINFFGSYARLADNKYLPQQRLRDCKVTLLGLGGLGTHLLMDMAALGIGHMRVVEFDRVELSNLNRQILYAEADLGRPKIELAVERVRQFSPRLDIEAIPQRLGSAADVMAAADGSDILICVADRPKMEILHWVNEAVVRAGIPLLTGGLDTQRCTYYTVIPGTTGCVECWRQQVHSDDSFSDDLLSRQRELQIGGNNAAFVPLVTVTTGLILGELVRLVTGLAPPIAAGRVIQVRFIDYATTEVERWERRPDCPVCSTASPAPTGRSDAVLSIAD
jgi:molybdopterin/thiamine biosynthesis adenylyltransferase